MTSITGTVKTARNLLRAFVALRLGESENAGKYFARAVASESADPIFDGIAKFTRDAELMSGEDEEMPMDMEEDDDLPPMDEDEDVSMGEEDEDMESMMSMDEEDDDLPMMDEEDEGMGEAEVPATVANVLGLRY